MPRLGLSNTPYTRPTLGLGTGIAAPPPSQPPLVGPPLQTPQLGGGVSDAQSMDPARLAAIRRNIGRLAIKKARSRSAKSKFSGMVTKDDIAEAQAELRARGLSFDDSLGAEPFQSAAGDTVPIRDFTRSFLRGIPLAPPTVYRQDAPGQPFTPRPAY